MCPVVAGPYAPWMLRVSPQGRIFGVSRNDRAHGRDLSRCLRVRNRYIQVAGSVRWRTSVYSFVRAAKLSLRRTVEFGKFDCRGARQRAPSWI